MKSLFDEREGKGAVATASKASPRHKPLAPAPGVSDRVPLTGIKQGPGREGISDKDIIDVVSISPISLSMLSTSSSPVITTVSMNNIKTNSGIKLISNVFDSPGELKNIRIIQAGDVGKSSGYMCPECKRSFSSEKYLSMHFSFHKPAQLQAVLSNPGALEVSDQTQLQTPGRKEEGKAAASKQTWTCKFCGKFFTQNSSYRNHLKTHSDERPYPCTICSIGFKEKYHLKKHVLYKHSTDLKERCRICGKPFKDSTAVRAHERIHSEVRPYKCNICEKSFKTSECLWHHENRSKTCGKAVTTGLTDDVANDVIRSENKPRARRNRRIAKSDTELMLSDENETQSATSSIQEENGDDEKFEALLLQQQNQLQLQSQLVLQNGQFINTVSGENLKSNPLTYRCVNMIAAKKPLVAVKSEPLPQTNMEGIVCPREWLNKDVKLEGSYSDSLNSLTSDDSESTCTQDAFSDLGDSDVPSPAESNSSDLLGCNSKKPNCSICGKKFLSQQTLNKHVMTMHGQDRPYRCHLCDNGFKLKVHLKKHHLYRHSNEYPCECTICGKRFKDTSAVRLHERIHSLDRPFECQCGKSFKTRENLWGHKNRGPCEVSEDFVASNMRLFRSAEFGPILGVPISSAAVLEQLNGILELQRLEMVNSATPSVGDLQTTPASMQLDVGSDLKREIKLVNSVKRPVVSPAPSVSGPVPTAVVMPLHKSDSSSELKQNPNVPSNTNISIPACTSSAIPELVSQLLTSVGFSSETVNPAILTNLISTLSSLGAGNANPALNQPQKMFSFGAGSSASDPMLMQQPLCNQQSIQAQNLLSPMKRRHSVNSFANGFDNLDQSYLGAKRRNTVNNCNPLYQRKEAVGSFGGQFTPVGLNVMNGSPAAVTLQQIQQIQQLQQLLQAQCSSNKGGEMSTISSQHFTELTTTTQLHHKIGESEEAVYLDDINLGASEDLTMESVQLMSWSDPVLPNGDFFEDFSSPVSPSLSEYDLVGVKLLDHVDVMGDDDDGTMNIFGSDEIYNSLVAEDDSLFNSLSPTFGNIFSLLI